jgi:hypothetical protein
MPPYVEPRLPHARGRGSWLQRALLVLVATALAIVATVFLTVALIAGAVLALVIGVRWWWTVRKLREQVKASGPLEGEYSVIERDESAHRLER